MATTRWILSWTLVALFALMALFHHSVPQRGGELASLRFEANLGQTDPQVRFLARGAGFDLFLTDHEAVFALGNGEAEPDTVRMSWHDSAAADRIEGRDRLQSRSNYFVGPPDRWRKNVPHYRQAAYTDLYPGTDLVFYGN